MCEYIILEDYIMEKYIYNEQNGLWYELQGDYYIPCLELPTEKKKGISAYGVSDICAISVSIRRCFTPTY